MNRIVINDLEMNKELDRAAMTAIVGSGILRSLFGFAVRQTRRTVRHVVRSGRDAARTAGRIARDVWRIIW